MPSDKLDYYRARAEAENAISKTTKDPAVAGIHKEMAALYERLIKLDETPDYYSVIPIDQARRA